MLQETKLKQIQEILSTYTNEELLWVNGYLNGLVAAKKETIVASSMNNVPQKITLLYGTETGNAKALTTKLAIVAKQNGLLSKVASLDQYRLSDLAKEEHLFIIISTQGEGEPPVGAKKFYDYIHQQTIQLNSTKFSVLGLGDSSYPLFCKTGEDVDIQLEKLGGKRIMPLQKCDVDYEQDAMQWFNKIINHLTSQTKSPTNNANIANTSIAKKSVKKIYNGTIVSNINLNDKGSLKETYHIEIITNEPIEYDSGDALAVIPKNKEFVVDSILMLTSTDEDKIVETSKYQGTIKELLINHLNICYLLASVIKKYAAIVGVDVPDVRMDLLDLIRIYPVKNAEQFIEVVKILTPIAPRLYTIASSPKQYENEVHILVRRDEYNVKEEKKYGLCSNFLGDMPVGEKVEFYIHKNKHFKLNTAADKVIMIGPGTGIAPFRAFLQETDVLGTKTNTWLFFGEHYFQKDFLYQTEIQNYLQTGVLHKLSVAFSREQATKMYVQHKLQQQAAEVFNWINDGATVYVSGTKEPMSIDVENCLIDIIEQQSGKTKQDAKLYLENMKTEGRYQKEVY